MYRKYFLIVFKFFVIAAAIQNLASAETQRLPTTCTEAFQRYGTKASGIYNIHLPESGIRPFPVYCLADPDNGQPWTVIQRRESASQTFYRGWNDYKIGFGPLHENLFIGLDKLHALTTQSEPQELWVQLRTNVTVNQYYSRFPIGDESQKYELNVITGSRGTAGYSMFYQKGMKFSTKDSDNDLSSGPCAVMNTGAWWYRDCLYSDLNGDYLAEGTKGIYWITFKQSMRTQYAHMAITAAKLN